MIGCWFSHYFICQIKEKIILAFEKAHGAGYQALIMVDNLQGHSAYSQDALIILFMNVKPVGMQAHMHDGWFMQDGEKVIQPMNYPVGHAEYQNQPKGIRAVLTECGLCLDWL